MYHLTSLDFKHISVCLRILKYWKIIKWRLNEAVSMSPYLLDFAKHLRMVNQVSVMMYLFKWIFLTQIGLLFRYHEAVIDNHFEKMPIYYHMKKKIRENILLMCALVKIKTVISRNICEKMVRVNLRKVRQSVERRQLEELEVEKK